MLAYRQGDINDIEKMTIEGEPFNPELPIVDGLGRPIHLIEGKHYTLHKRQYYYVALLPGELEQFKPSFGNYA